MAKQAGPIFFVGTIDDLVFYKLGDQYYVKRKSDYSKREETLETKGCLSSYALAPE